ncbi:MAG: T9SS type A sorting domain-containing protein [Flavobacteriales bacterium]|nr:T9SS type A sorting domain-containing protein [Flavobacteriales bacterium]
MGRHRMATAEGGFVAGGADSSYAPLDECWSYNTFDEWTPMPAMPEGRFGGSGASWTEGLYYIAGAIDNSNFRATTFRLSASGWELADAVLPSERRGGVVAVSGCAGGWNFLNYGLGLDGTMARRNDWFGTSFAFSIGEKPLSFFSIFPNPATEAIRLPDGMSYNEAIIFNAQGVVAGRIQENNGLVLPIHHLSAGAYMLQLRLNEGFSTARFIKLP